MNITSLSRGAWAAAIVLCLGASASPLCGQGITASRAAQLNRWDAGGPSGPIRPIPPIHPIHPIRPWPWWGPNVVVYNPYPWGVGNYLYPPTRWDAPAWDGQTRDTTPPPAPRTPREPQRPLVMEWNAAKGRAEVVHLDRWDGEAAPANSEVPPSAPTPSPTPATKSLDRWDD